MLDQALLISNGYIFQNIIWTGIYASWLAAGAESRLFKHAGHESDSNIGIYSDLSFAVEKNSSR